MSKLKPIIFIFLLLIGFSSNTGVRAEMGGAQSLAVTPLAVEGKNGLFEYEVELAVTRQEHAIGLMHRHEMAENHGMLFLNETIRFNSFWMENTYISLDIIFVKFDGTISNIVANTIPLSRDQILSTSPVLAVLELNAGQAAKIGLRAGDMVYHDIFDNYPPQNLSPASP